MLHCSLAVSCQPHLITACSGQIPYLHSILSNCPTVLKILTPIATECNSESKLMSQLYQHWTSANEHRKTSYLRSSKSSSICFRFFDSYVWKDEQGYNFCSLSSVSEDTTSTHSVWKVQNYRRNRLSLIQWKPKERLSWKSKERLQPQRLLALRNTKQWLWTSVPNSQSAYLRIKDRSSCLEKLGVTMLQCVWIQSFNSLRRSQKLSFLRKKIVTEIQKKTMCVCV